MREVSGNSVADQMIDIGEAGRRGGGGPADQLTSRITLLPGKRDRAVPKV